MIMIIICKSLDMDDNDNNNYRQTMINDIDDIEASTDSLFAASQSIHSKDIIYKTNSDKIDIQKKMETKINSFI